MFSLMAARRLRGTGLVFGLALSLIFGLAAAPAAADLPAGGATGSEVAALLRDLGYTTDITTDKDGSPLIHTTMAATKIDVYFYNCASSRCTSIQFVAGFAISGVTLSTINTWDKDKRYGRAYISTEGYPFMEVDVDISNGATTSEIRAYIRHVEALVPDFKTAIGYKG